MSNSPNRRKKFQIQSDKENYQGHVIRLEKIMGTHNREHLLKEEEERKLFDTIRTMRKMHANNREYRARQMKSIERAFNEKTKKYGRVKSVVKEDMDRSVPPVPPRHKRKDDFIAVENEKMLNRILQVKPKLHTRTCRHQKSMTKLLPQISNDFSIIYENSKLNVTAKKTHKRTLIKSKQSKAMYIEFMSSNLKQLFKDTLSLYNVEITCAGSMVKINHMMLEEFDKVKLCLKLPLKKLYNSDMKITFFKILDNKEIHKGSIYLTPDDYSSFDESTASKQLHLQQLKLNKAVYNPKGKQQIKSRIHMKVEISAQSNHILQESARVSN